MPRKAISSKKIEVGKKGGGKHWTKSQKNARENAAAGLTRKSITLTCPKWLTSDARAIWDQSTTDAAELELLDNLDVNQLAAYCVTVAEYQTWCKKNKDPDVVRIMIALGKEMLSYADKLGFTPQARARLAQRRAAKELDEDKFGAEFDQ